MKRSVTRVLWGRLIASLCRLVCPRMDKMPGMYAYRFQAVAVMPAGRSKLANLRKADATVIR